MAIWPSDLLGVQKADIRAVIKSTATGTMPPANRTKPPAKEVERFTTNGHLVLEPEKDRK